MSDSDHIEIHKEIDKEYPRWRGKKYYDQERAANPNFDNEVFVFLKELYEKYIAKYPTLLDDFINNFSNRNK